MALALVVGGCSHPRPFVDIDRKLERWDDLGIPIVGAITYRAELASPKDEYATATGTVTVRCDHCALGDGVTKLRPSASSAFAADGIDFGKVELGKIDGTATFASGKGTIHLGAGTHDTVEIKLDGTVKLANDLAKSDVDLHLAFRVSEALNKSDPKTYSVLMLTGAKIDDRGWFRIHIIGPLDSARRLAE